MSGTHWNKPKNIDGRIKRNLMANFCGEDLIVLSSNQVMPKKSFHDTGSDVIIPFIYLFIFLV